MNSTLENSIVLITSSNPKDKKDVIGTGFVIYKEAETTYLLTCAHVVKDVGGNDSVQIYGQPANVIASSDVNDFDLAVVQVNHEKPINRSVLGLQNSGQEGTSVKAAGYYLFSTEKKRSLATIQGVLGKQKYREDQDTGERAIVWEVNINNKDQLQKGYSGSPLVDPDSGFVIGVITNMGTGGQTGEIISIEALQIICPRWFKKKLKYNKLLCFLETGKWKEADEETSRLMVQIGDKDDKGYLNENECRNFPKKELRTIDRLWLKYSNNRFGLSVQKEIYLREGGKLDDIDWGVYEKMSDIIGWRQGGEWLGYDRYTFNTNAPKGHLPSLCLFGVDYGLRVLYLFSLL